MTLTVCSLGGQENKAFDRRMRQEGNDFRAAQT